MADETQELQGLGPDQVTAMSPLTLTGAAAAGTPNPSTDAMGALRSMQMDRMQKGQTYLDQQRATYDAQMNKYRAMLSQPRESEEAAKWGAIAGGAAKIPAMVGNFGQMLASMGQANGEQQYASESDRMNRQTALTKLEEDYTNKLGAQQEKLVASTMQQGAKSRPVKLADGTWGTWDAVTQTIIPVPQSQQAALQKDFDTYYKMAQKMMPEEKDESKIQEFANELMSRKASLREANPVSTTAGTLPVIPAKIPGAAPDTAEPAVPGSFKKVTPGMVGSPETESPATLGLDAQAAEIAKKLDAIRSAMKMPQYKENPAIYADLQGQEKALLTQIASLEKGSPITRPAVAAKPSIQLVPKSEEAGRIKTAEKAAEEHTKYSEGVTERSQNFQNMSTILDGIDKDLQAMKPGAPIEPGKLANFNTGALSWIKAMGVPLSQEAEDAIASSIATGKANIKLSAADTKAISSRPAVFEFMQMLKSNPGPELTPDTIKRLTNKMRENIRIGAQENQDFSDWHKENPQAPVADFTNYRNLVYTPWWSKFSEKYNAANGRYPTYADITSDAKERGVSFNDMVRKMHAESSKRR